MSFKSIVFFFYIITIIINYVHCFDPAGILGSIGETILKVGNTVEESTYCMLFECCNDAYIVRDVQSLNSNLAKHLYGQHIVLDTVPTALAGHFLKKSNKPLVMSFHGWPGTGKNFVADFIVSALYKNGHKSKYVHQYNGGSSFPLPQEKDNYKIKLLDEVKRAVKRCPKSLFIFDEVDKMEPGILDVIKPMLDYHKSVDNVDYRESIFIFLSNKGASNIADHLLSLWKNGIQREDTTLSHFERLVVEGAFNEQGGFKGSENIKGGVIDHFIPFFPMERRHVELCVKAEFTKHNIHHPSEADLEEVMSYATYGSTNSKSPSIFANSGCKRVAGKVSTLISRKFFDLKEL